MEQLLTEATIYTVVGAFKTLAINNDDFRCQSTCLALLRLLRAQGLLSEFEDSWLGRVLERCVDADSSDLDPDEIAKEVEEILEMENAGRSNSKVIFEGPLPRNLAKHIADTLDNLHVDSGNAYMWNTIWTELKCLLCDVSLIDFWRMRELHELALKLCRDKCKFTSDEVRAAVYAITNARDWKSYSANIDG